jgi:hypothetical protein
LPLGGSAAFARAQIAAILILNPSGDFHESNRPEFGTHAAWLQGPRESLAARPKKVRRQEALLAIIGSCLLRAHMAMRQAIR